MNGKKAQNLQLVDYYSSHFIVIAIVGYPIRSLGCTGKGCLWGSSPLSPTRLRPGIEPPSFPKLSNLATYFFQGDTSQYKQFFQVEIIISSIDQM